MIDGIQLLFSDKQVTYSTFMEDLSAQLAVKLHSLQQYPEKLSQNKAWERFGKAKVKDWVKRNLVQPKKVGKQRLEYNYSELYILEQQNQ